MFSRACLNHLAQQTVQVDRDALLTLTQESLEKGVDKLTYKDVITNMPDLHV